MARKAGVDRDQVIAVAATLADRDGLDALTLSAVAAQLGIRTPSLYAHVDGLPGLRRELAMLGAHAMAESFAAATARRRGRGAARALAHAFRRYAVEHPGCYAAAVPAPASDDAEHQAAARAPVEVVVGVLRGLGVPERRLIHVARAWRAALHGFVTLERAGGFGLPEAVDESFDLMVDGLVRGLPR